MTDIDQAAERVRAYEANRSPCEVWKSESLAVAFGRMHEDRKMLADAYLAQQPSYAAQAAEIAELRKDEASDLRPDSLPLSGCCSKPVEFVAENDNFYCTQCRCGQGTEYYRAARRRSARKLLAHKERELAELRAKLEDNPETDCTDAAHPAWWRGSDHAYAVMCKEIAELLDGKPLAGSCSQPWQGIRERITALRTAVAPFEDEQVVDEAWCRAKFGEAWATSGDCAIYRAGVIYVRINYELVRKDIKEIVTVSLHGLDVLEMPTIGQLNHLLAALRPGGVK